MQKWFLGYKILTKPSDPAADNRALYLIKQRNPLNSFEYTFKCQGGLQ